VDSIKFNQIEFDWNFHENVNLVESKRENNNLLSSVQFMNLSSIHVNYIKSKLNYENTFNIYI
jgi:hypothetical protein